MDALTAINIIESDEDANDREIIAAFASLIKSGVVWTLQGFYGRTANVLIDGGYITPMGDVIDG